MRERNVRSLVLYAAVFVFLCLLLSGSPRLIGGQHSPAVPDGSARALSSIPVSFTAANMPQGESASPLQTRNLLARRETLNVSSPRDLPVPVMCDANGNVLGQRSYMHEVYQVFSLGDGFA